MPIRRNPPGPRGGIGRGPNPPGPVGGIGRGPNPPGPVGGIDRGPNPPGFGTKEEVKAKFDASVSEIVDALEKTPEDEMKRVIKIGENETSPFDLVTFCAMHINYHDAQLDFIQALCGDTEMHWED